MEDKKNENQTSEPKNDATNLELKETKEMSDTNETKAKKQRKTADTQDDKKDTFEDYKAEFKKIVWPSRPEIVKKTITVIGMSFVVGIIIFAMDTVLSAGYTAVVTAIKGDLTTQSDQMFEITPEMLQNMTVDENGETILEITPEMLEGMNLTTDDGSSNDGVLEITPEMLDTDSIVTEEIELQMPEAEVEVETETEVEAE